MRASALWTVILATQLAGCGYNTFQSQDEQVKAAWSEVVNEYQRRADLIPNLVETVKGFAQQEQRRADRRDRGAFESRQIQATPELINDPQAFQQFQAAQGELSSALSRLMVVVEIYPGAEVGPKLPRPSSAARGTENRITVARNRYIATVQDYNVTVRSFPSNVTAMIFGYKAKPNFTVENESAISKPPPVSFERK